jgi:hypothetical protein
MALIKNTLSRLRTPAGASIVVGMWLYVSAFVLPQSFNSAMITWALGVLISLAAVAAFIGSKLRYLDALLAMLLAIAAAGLADMPALTRVHDLLVAILVLALALAGVPSGPRFRHPRHA